MRNSFFSKNISMLLVSLSISASFVGCATTNNLTNPKNTAVIKTQIAVEHIKNGDIDSAKNALDDAIQKDPQNALAYMMMGVTYQLDGNANSLKQADSFFKKAISLDPQNAQIRNNYGQYLFVIENYKAAINEFSIAANTIGYNGRDVAYSNLGYSYYNVQDMNKAQSSFISSLKVNPNYPDSLLGISEVFYNTGNIAEAQTSYQDYARLLNKDNRDAKGLWMGIRLAHLNENYVEMNSLLSLLSSKFPKSKEYQSYLKQRSNKDAAWYK